MIHSVYETDLEEKFEGSMVSIGAATWASQSSESLIDIATRDARKNRVSDDPGFTLVSQGSERERLLTLRNETSPPTPEGRVDQTQVNMRAISDPPKIRTVMRHHDDSGIRFDVVKVVDVPPAYTTT